MQRAGRGWQFIDLAELGINTRRSYLVSTLYIVLSPLGFLMLCGSVLAVASLIADRPPEELLKTKLIELTVWFGAIIVVGIATIWSVIHTHRRPWRSLVSFDLTLDRGRLAIGAGVEVALTAGVLYSLGVLDRAPDFTVTASVPLLALALMLIPLQAASEEILFRGYLTQALGRLVRYRGVIAIIVGLVFALLHGNQSGPWTIPYMFLVSLVYSLVSLRDGRIELVIGSHVACNLLDLGGIRLVNSELTWTEVALVPVYGAAFYGLTRLLVPLCRRQASDG